MMGQQGRVTIGRLAFQLCALGAGFFMASAPALAQAGFPARPIHLIVPAPPGGAGDTSARAIAQHMSTTLKQPVIVENKPGAAATIGYRNVASAAPDGYTFGLVPVAGTAIATVTYNDLPDIQKDFVMIAGIANAPHMLVVPSSLGVNSVDELIKLFRKKPGEYNYASQGAGSLSHIESAVFLAASKVEAVHVPYKGSSAAMPGLISGSTSMMFDSVSSILPQVKAGKLVPLATAATQRVPQFPNVPTMSELGIELKADNAFALLAPAGTPAETAAILTNAVASALADPKVIATLENTGIVAKFTPPDAFQPVVASEFALWPSLARKLTVSSN